MFKSDLLAGQRILITGGGTGIGLSIGRHFLTLGAEIVICGRRENVLAEAAEELMRETGGKVAYKSCDVRDPGQVDALCDWIWQEAPLTGLINNAAGNFIAQSESCMAQPM
jgi:short-subunit dehydrogenase involved in D-alanine esterification of teichoic acids